MNEHPIDVDATIKRIKEHSRAIEVIKQRMLRRELDPERAWAAIKALGVPQAVRVNPGDVFPGKMGVTGKRLPPHEPEFHLED